MLVINEINKIENKVILDYSSLPVWKTIYGLSKDELSQLLINNYKYSAQFPKIIETAFNNSTSRGAKIAIEYIINEENTPEEHIKMHEQMLEKCGLDIFNNIEKNTLVEELVSKSFIYAHPKNEQEELAMLLFFRVGSEILAGDLYRVLAKIVPKQFGVSLSDIEFITLHGEHDCKSTDLGYDVVGNTDTKGSLPHADYFNDVITKLVEKIGSESLGIAETTYKDAYLLRKFYVEYLAGSL